MENVLVTGGCGFIGGHLVDKLINEGKNVLVVDDESSVVNEKFHYRDEATYYGYDISKYSELKQLFKNNDIDTIFHLAARSRIPYSIEEPIDTCHINFMGTLNVLELARQNKVERVLYSSTSSAYGLKNDPPLREDMKPDCLNPYSVSKVAAEDLCKMYNDLYDLNTITFRYFNVYGERQPLKGSYAPVIGIFLRQKAAGEEMTIVGDGLQTRDFTHVSDVVNANILAAKTQNKEAFGEVFNVGAGKNHSVLSISQMIGGSHVFIPDRKGEVRSTLADTNKIKKILGWKAKMNLENWIGDQL